VTIKALGGGKYLVLAGKRGYVVRQGREVIKRTGRGRQFMKFLEGVVRRAEKFCVTIGVPTPAEVRQLLTSLGYAWTGLQVAFERLAEAMGLRGFDLVSEFEWVERFR